MNLAEIKKTILILFGLTLSIVLLGFVSVHAQECSCGCINFGGGVSDIGKFCGTGIFSSPKSFPNECNTGYSKLFTKNCGGYGEGCWSTPSCIKYDAGCCNGVCFSNAERQCCSDESGLLCNQNETCCDSNNDWKTDSCMIFSSDNSEKCGSIDKKDLGDCKECKYNNLTQCIKKDTSLNTFYWSNVYLNSYPENKPNGTSCQVNGTLGYCKSGECIKPAEPIYEVKLKLDPEYQAKTEKERGFYSTDITPFDDLICEIKTNDVSYLNLQTELVTINKNGKETIVAPSTTNYSRDEGEFRVYQAKFKGWPIGLSSNIDIMEKIIENQNLKCKISVSDKPKESKEVKTSNCVHLQGYSDSDFKHSPPFKIVNMRGISSSMNPFEILSWGKASIIHGFNMTEPFDRYIDKFSFYADLVNHDDSKWNILVDYIGNFFDTETYKIVPKISSCGNNNRLYFFYSDRTYSAYTRKFNKVVFLNEASISTTVIHETGHAFCGLYDEYNRSIMVNMLGSAYGFSYGTNCVENPNYSWGDYGDNIFQGCAYYSNYFRPSLNSIMNNPFEVRQFNVVSCGYCSQAINGGDKKEYWKECCNMAGVIKPLAGCPKQ